MKKQDPSKSSVKVSKSDTMSEKLSCFIANCDNIEAVFFPISIGIRID